MDDLLIFIFHAIVVLRSTSVVKDMDIKSSHHPCTDHVSAANEKFPFQPPVSEGIGDGFICGRDNSSRQRQKYSIHPISDLKKLYSSLSLSFGIGSGSTDENQVRD